MKISDIITEVLKRPSMQDVQTWWVRNVIQVPHSRAIPKDITHQDVYNEINNNWDEYKNLQDGQIVISLAFQSVIKDYAEKIRATASKQPDSVKPTAKVDEPEFRKDVAGRTLRDPRYYRDRDKPKMRDRAAVAKTRAGKAYRAGRDLPRKLASGPTKFIQDLRDLSKKLN